MLPNDISERTSHLPGRSPMPIRRVLSERQRFLIFVRKLFAALDRDPCDAALRNRAKAVISDCIQLNREGDPLCTPLHKAVVPRLRRVVGESYWREAKLSTAYYSQKNGFLSGVAV
jgi:hypothetical protein